ncbi:MULTISPECIES: glycoside hydrolase family 3 N-terminal domain-containing protein [Lactobacillales]|uniref:glycoside hydrolase family 3 N-terminal domain-containing protein n=1 Tax=Lactobacillales TaxID=186826 RepID=UPI002FCADC7B
MLYTDKNQLPSERAKDLLRRLSFEEKIGQLVGYNPAYWSNDKLLPDYSDGVGQVSLLVGAELDTIYDVADYQKKLQKEIMALTKFNIPAIFHVEVLTGLKLPNATTFPSGIGQAASFDIRHQKKIGQLIGAEARAIGATQAFAPVLDISRDSRFGRQGETFGEDPTLAAALGSKYVQGLQEGNRVMSVAKHFLGYQNSQGGIHAATADVPERMLREVYAKPFQAAITEAGIQAVMPCYSTINSEPVSGSKSILTKLLREEMGFEGLVVSDYCAVREIHERQMVASSYAKAGKMALLAGMDQELPSRKCYSSDNFKQWENDQEFITKVNSSVYNILLYKFKLGLFEDPYAKNEEAIREIFENKYSKKISLTSARESLVLLKNDGVLPLEKKSQNIAVIGHHANSLRPMFGGYSYMSTTEKRLGATNTMAGINPDNQNSVQKQVKEKYKGSVVEKEHPDADKVAKQLIPNVTSLFEELGQKVSNVSFEYAYGYPFVGNDDSFYEEALQTAGKSDVILLTVGGKYGTGSTASIGEGIDATDINLPVCQENFIEKVSQFGKPIILIHFGGRPISSDAADKYASAIIEAWNPGEFGSTALVETLFGDYNPSGKMPLTTAFSAGQIPVFYNHLNGSSYNQNTGGAFGGYVDCPHEPRYYFGHGLSYTDFDYSNLEVTKETNKKDGNIFFSVDLKNTGKYAGTEVVQLYVKDCYASTVRPVIELTGFYRVHLEINQTKRIIFTVNPSQFSFLDNEMKWRIESGDMKVYVGSSVKDIRAEGQFTLNKSYCIDGKNRKFYADTKELTL